MKYDVDAHSHLCRLIIPSNYDSYPEPHEKSLSLQEIQAYIKAENMSLEEPCLFSADWLLEQWRFQDSKANRAKLIY
ncbi:unnamed protein product [Prunus armeniaca]|uniref:Uncharacterized protein n=1 Tax=Prunus armeniaca TaxID=36596 RepID=A0A6J5W6U5_PRUAR|nr:unnamed protein product [Prunus armeniaca]